MAALCLAGAVPAATAQPTARQGTIVLQCPRVVETRQALGSPVAGWTGERKTVGHPLEGYSIFAGPVSKMVQLREDEVDKGTSIYGFEGLPDQARFVCLYRGTNMTLTRLLPVGIKQCRMTSATVPNAPDRVTLACR